MILFIYYLVVKALVIILHVVKQGITVNRPEILEHANDTLTEDVRRYILRSKDDKVCKIPCYLIGDHGKAGHVAEALREFVYASGENGNKEVQYKPRKAINLSPTAVRVLKDKFGD